MWLRAFGLPLPIALMFGLENTQGKGKFELNTYECQPVSYPNKTRTKSATLATLMVVVTVFLTLEVLQWLMADPDGSDTCAYNYMHL